MGHLGEGTGSDFFACSFMGVGGNVKGSEGIYLPRDPEEGWNYSFNLLF